MNVSLAPFPRTSLALLPTPVKPLAGITKHTPDCTLYVKHDDLSGPVYGGNKIRKLEFLLGQALAEGRKTVITYGAAGSNHALATAICCRQLGLQAVSILAPQETSEHVKKNILMGHAAGADLQLCGHYREFPERTRAMIEKYLRKNGIEPFIIPAGGTNARGALGFVNAAFEMKEQIIPDVIYLPMGTGGTLSGLLVGLRLAGLRTRVEAVRVVEPAFRNRTHIKQLCDEICDLLGQAPVVHDEDIGIRDEFFGEAYGIPTLEGQRAVNRFRDEEQMVLENTYTGKTAAALLHDLESGAIDNQTVLYWNTLNSRDFSREIANVDFHSLPPVFQTYFE